VNPDQIRQALADRHARQSQQKPLRLPADSVGLQPREDTLYANIAASYFTLRIGLALMAFVLPIALWISAGPDSLQGSISAYYHYAAAQPAEYGAGSARNIMVGTLWAVGTFLFFYKGYSRAEDWVLDLAGVAAVLISLFPMDWPPVPEVPHSQIATVHYVSAAAFFVAIAYVCVFRSNDTLAIMTNDVRKRFFRRVYVVLAAAMVAMPTTVWLRHVLTATPENGHFLFWVEVTGVYVYATFWLVKSREIWEIENPRVVG
jgi:hypothetical protein